MGGKSKVYEGKKLCERGSAELPPLEMYLVTMWQLKCTRSEIRRLKMLLMCLFLLHLQCHASMTPWLSP